MQEKVTLKGKFVITVCCKDGSPKPSRPKKWAHSLISHFQSTGHEFRPGTERKIGVIPGRARWEGMHSEATRLAPSKNLWKKVVFVRAGNGENIQANRTLCTPPQEKHKTQGERAAAKMASTPWECLFCTPTYKNNITLYENMIVCLLSASRQVSMIPRIFWIFLKVFGCFWLFF